MIRDDEAIEPEGEEENPWYDESLLPRLTDVEKAEYKAWADQRREDELALLAALDPKKNYGLDFEILLWAFEELKEHPEKTIAEVIGYGFCEWVK